ncbi:MAG: GGDEF domain-containing protein [Betaproteobacteria bacterium]|nr:GGDEF domain-containing protein [Betaproteobacteria bacterium]
MRPKLMRLIAGDDPRQILRMRRYFMALGASAMALALFGLAGWAGVIDSATLISASALTLALAGAFFLVFRCGWNLRFGDPSLTAPMTVAALASLLFVISRAGQGHVILLPLIPVVYLFGVFRLDSRTMLKITAGASAGYAAILAFNAPGQVPDGDYRLAVLYWAVFTAVAAFFSMLGGHISDLRRRVSAGKHKLQRAFDRIEHMASHDSLTGVLNRRRVLEILAQERSRCLRFGTLFSICLIDIDHFKNVNDTYGHAAGDAVLRGFAGAISATLRDTDHLGRLGGEEFVAVFSGTLIDGAIIGAERMRSAVVRAHYPGAPNELQITLSAGVACYRSGESIEELLARADVALYGAKNAGRDCVVSAAA